MTDLATEAQELRPRISVIGVGGAGGNAVANMIRCNARGIDFVVANTDSQALRKSDADQLIQLGAKTTEGLGAGANAAIGRAAAEESLTEIEKALAGKHICFIAAGLGGGTGTGAAPIIAKAARDKGILTVGIVTTPFAFEGARRAKVAEAGLEELARHVDTLIVIPNQNLFRVTNSDTTFKAAFEMADQVLHLGVQSLTDLMVSPGHVNLDFADIRTIMLNMGRAVIGTGVASGDDRAIRAAEAAMSNPLLDDAMCGARGLIISISGGDDLRLMEVDEAASHIKDNAHPDAEIIWGSTFSPDLAGEIRVSVVATGIHVDAQEAIASAPVKAPTMNSLFERFAQAEDSEAELGLSVESTAPTLTDAALITLEPPWADELFKCASDDAGFHSSDSSLMKPELTDILLLTAERALPATAAEMLPVAGPIYRPNVLKIDRRIRTTPSLFERMVTAARETVAHA